MQYISIEEYLEMEDSSVEKHEYYEGEVFTMAGAGYNHNLIVGNALGEIRQHLKNKPCNIFPGDLKVHIESNTLRIPISALSVALLSFGTAVQML